MAKTPLSPLSWARELGVGRERFLLFFNCYSLNGTSRALFCPSHPLCSIHFINSLMLDPPAQVCMWWGGALHPLNGASPTHPRFHWCLWGNLQEVGPFCGIWGSPGAPGKLPPSLCQVIPPCSAPCWLGRLPGPLTPCFGSPSSTCWVWRTDGQGDPRTSAKGESGGDVAVSSPASWGGGTFPLSAFSVTASLTER